MATILSGGDLSLLSGKVAIIGYGAQGHAHALNLRDSGVEVHVGLREGSPSRGKAEASGLTVGTAGEATRGAQLVAILVPDQVAPKVFAEEVEPNLEPGAVVLFAHGFNILYGRIAPAAGHATSRSPTRPGSAQGGRGSSRRRSARRPRPTCSVSRSFSAAG